MSSSSQFFRIPQYHRFLGPVFARELLRQATAVPGVPGLTQVGVARGNESSEALQFLVELYERLESHLAQVLRQRERDRAFLDERTRACAALNAQEGTPISDPAYRTVIGLEDSEGRVVFGPLRPDYARPGGAPIAPIPPHLQGPHVTLFGPPDQAKLAVNAMNAYHRKLPGEPAIVEELLSAQPFDPKWGADDEDSKTPMRETLVDAALNLKGCFDGTLAVRDEKSGKNYELAPTRRSLPLKRFPGLALPCAFLFYRESPIPLHLYDFALHVFNHWHQAEALTFYVPKLENEEEAAYIHAMVREAEASLQARHPGYQLGTVRLMIVLENPRAILRTHEIMDALYPYFVGASLGWHDYLGSTARLFNEDPHYRIPVKADPDIVIKYIQASHRLVAEVVGSRGGIKVGGMYGILPVTTDLQSESFQVTLLGYFRDVITQFKRRLNGFWVAHPDFVRLGLALVEAWRRREAGEPEFLRRLCREILQERYATELERFIDGPDVPGLDLDDPGYVRSLIVADIEESDTVPNHDLEEVRYNVFQSLQYLVDWLSGNGCVALPALVRGTPVRVMDDLATAERSRWEVWHEIRQGRVSLDDFLRIAFEEFQFIRKDLSNEQKIVQVKWDARTARWYPVAFRLMVQLMTARDPAEFATELLLPFTMATVREAADPWQAALDSDPAKYTLRPEVARWMHFFEACGSQRFARTLAAQAVYDRAHAAKLVLSFSKEEVIEAASFHGDIGEPKKGLDARAFGEQAGVSESELGILSQLRTLGAAYRERFGFKFLISAQGRSGGELLAALTARLARTTGDELQAAREALWEITEKRLLATPPDTLLATLEEIRKRHGVRAAGVAIAMPSGASGEQALALGGDVQTSTRFQLASLSKTVASAFALEFLRSRGISCQESVNELLARFGSAFRLRAQEGVAIDPDRVRVVDLMSHTALNLHYVAGIPLTEPMPKVAALLPGNERWGYAPVAVIHSPGEKFQYSGGGFLVLEHLIEQIAGTSIPTLTAPFLKALGAETLTFDPSRQEGEEVALGTFDDGTPVPGGWLQFPAFAAGALATPLSMLRVLRQLERAYQDASVESPVSHDTAVEMLKGRDRGCREFMGCDMGVGVFVTEAGENRLMLHQGANEGFRALFIHCFAGPDRGKGFVILCNADQAGVRFVAEAAQGLLQGLGFQGIAFDRFLKSFDASAIPQEQRVNLGYRDLVFRSFEPQLPEKIEPRGRPDPWASQNAVVGATILRVSNQRFARAENLISAFLPTFDPELYGRQGKVMDSWESARHNPEGVDFVEVRLLKSVRPRYVSFSTEYHDGNQAESVQLWGRRTQADGWQALCPRMRLEGHSLLKLDLGAAASFDCGELRVEMFPDGGLSRLGVFESLPNAEAECYAPLATARGARFAHEIPKPKKPLTLPYSPRSSQGRCRSVASSRTDWASLAHGGRVLSVSNEHYGPASQVISPYPPLHMFDGFESARSRTPDHQEELVLGLGQRIRVRELCFDFTFFVNNNPSEVRVLARGATREAWRELVPRTSVKAFAANQCRFKVTSEEPWSELKIEVFPDGGINRVHVYGDPET